MNGWGMTSGGAAGGPVADPRRRDDTAPRRRYDQAAFRTSKRLVRVGWFGGLGQLSPSPPCNSSEGPVAGWATDTRPRNGRGCEPAVGLAPADYPPRASAPECRARCDASACDGRGIRGLGRDGTGRSGGTRARGVLDSGCGSRERLHQHRQWDDGGVLCRLVHGRRSRGPGRSDLDTGGPGWRRRRRVRRHLRRTPPEECGRRGSRGNGDDPRQRIAGWDGALFRPRLRRRRR